MSKPLYEDGGRQAGIDYMEEPASCDYCGLSTDRRGMIEHATKTPCPGLLASQQEGERIIRMIQDQTQDPEPF